jgi:bifunctional non-homologous end joining protein LigD
MVVERRPVEHLALDGREVRITNPDRVLWPETGTTKRELIEYELEIAPLLLEHVRGRGLTLGRWPEGVDRPGWLQAECRGRPSWLPVQRVTTRRGGSFGYCMVEDRAGLAWIANLGTIELHPFLGRAELPEEPTALVFDLDPGPPAGVVDAGRVALEIRDRLDRAGFASFAKTSGMLGIHVFAPLAAGHRFHETKAFARAIARDLASRDTLQVTDLMARSARAGRVYIDWVQNDQSRSTVAAWSPRAAAFPTVSMPLTWTELERATANSDRRALTFTIRDATERARRLGDPSAPFLLKGARLRESRRLA